MGKKTAEKVCDQASSEDRVPKNLRIDRETLKRFETICKALGKMQSRVVEKWMKDEFIPTHRNLLEEGS